MIECIVLDGWHKGHTIVLPDTRQTISLLRPPVVTIDDCCNGEVANSAEKGIHNYQLAFMSVDRKIALYSKDGSSRAIKDGRAWVVPVDKNWVEQPLYVGIHDERAYPEDTKPEQKEEVV